MVSLVDQENAKKEVRKSGLAQLYTLEEFRSKFSRFLECFPVDIGLGKTVLFEKLEDGSDQPKLRFSGSVSGLGGMTFSKEAYESLGSMVGLSPSYLSKVPVDLVIPHLNFWYGKAWADKGLRVFCNELNCVEAVSRKAHVDYIPLEALLDGAINQFGGEARILGIHKARVGFHKTMFSVVLKRDFEVVKGDKLFMGVRFEHSLTGEKPTQVVPYTFRQVCSNGAVTKDQLAVFSRRNSANQFNDWMVHVLNEASKLFELETERLRNLTQTPTPNRISVLLDDLFSRNGVSKQIRDEVSDAVLDESPETMYDIYNVLTRVGTHSEFFEKHPNVMDALEGAAADLSSNHAVCKSCGRRKKK